MNGRWTRYFNDFRAHLNFCGDGALLKGPVFTAILLAPCFSWVLAVVVTSEPLERFIGTRKTAEAVVGSSPVEHPAKAGC